MQLSKIRIPGLSHQTSKTGHVRAVSLARLCHGAAARNTLTGRLFLSQEPPHEGCWTGCPPPKARDREFPARRWRQLVPIN